MLLLGDNQWALHCAQAEVPYRRCAGFRVGVGLCVVTRVTSVWYREVLCVPLSGTVVLSSRLLFSAILRSRRCFRYEFMGQMMLLAC